MQYIMGWGSRLGQQKLILKVLHWSFVIIGSSYLSAFLFCLYLFPQVSQVSLCGSRRLIIHGESSVSLFLNKNPAKLPENAHKLKLHYMPQQIKKLITVPPIKGGDLLTSLGSLSHKLGAKIEKEWSRRCQANLSRGQPEGGNQKMLHRDI